MTALVRKKLNRMSRNQLWSASQNQIMKTIVLQTNQSRSANNMLKTNLKPKLFLKATKCMMDQQVFQTNADMKN